MARLTKDQRKVMAGLSMAKLSKRLTERKKELEAQPLDALPKEIQKPLEGYFLLLEQHSRTVQRMNELVDELKDVVYLHKVERISWGNPTMKQAIGSILSESDPACIELRGKMDAVEPDFALMSTTEEARDYLDSL